MDEHLVLWCRHEFVIQAVDDRPSLARTVMKVNFIEELLPLPVLQLSAIFTYRSANIRPLVYKVGEIATVAIVCVAKLAKRIAGDRRFGKLRISTLVNKLFRR